MREEVNLKNCKKFLKIWKPIKKGVKPNKRTFLTINEILSSHDPLIFKDKDNIKPCIQKLFEEGYLIREKRKNGKKDDTFQYRPIKAGSPKKSEKPKRKDMGHEFEKLFEDKENELLFQSEIIQEMRSKHQTGRTTTINFIEEKLAEKFLTIVKGKGSRQLYRPTHVSGQHSKAALPLLMKESKNSIKLSRNPNIWFDLQNFPTIFYIGL